MLWFSLVLFEYLIPVPFPRHAWPQLRDIGSRDEYDDPLYSFAQMLAQITEIPERLVLKAGV
jgi:hypothetical protein